MRSCDRSLCLPVEGWQTAVFVTVPGRGCMTFTQRQVTLASWITVFSGLLLVLPLKLLPSLLAGLLVFELVIAALLLDYRVRLVFALADAGALALSRPTGLVDLWAL